jgi:hypothetical protein
MRVYQQVIDMGDGGVQVLETVIGCTLDEAFALLPAAGFCPPIVHRPKKTPPSPRRGGGWKAQKPLASRDFSEAAEGTRTLDLLHGKQTLIVRPDRFIPAYRATSPPSPRRRLSQVSPLFVGVLAPNWHRGAVARGCRGHLVRSRVGWIGAVTQAPLLLYRCGSAAGAIKPQARARSFGAGVYRTWSETPARWHCGTGNGCAASAAASTPATSCARRSKRSRQWVLRRSPGAPERETRGHRRASLQAQPRHPGRVDR